MGARAGVIEFLEFAASAKSKYRGIRSKRYFGCEVCSIPMALHEDPPAGRAIPMGIFPMSFASRRSNPGAADPDIGATAAFIVTIRPDKFRARWRWANFITCRWRRLDDNFRLRLRGNDNRLRRRRVNRLRRVNRPRWRLDNHLTRRWSRRFIHHFAVRPLGVNCAPTQHRDHRQTAH